MYISVLVFTELEKNNVGGFRKNKHLKENICLKYPVSSNQLLQNKCVFLEILDAREQHQKTN